MRLSPSDRLVGGGPKMGEGTRVTRSHLSMQGACVKGVKRVECDLAHHVETLAVRSACGGRAQDGGGDNRHQVPPEHAGTMCGKCEKCGGGGVPTGPTVPIPPRRRLASVLPHLLRLPHHHVHLLPAAVPHPYLFCLPRHLPHLLLSGPSCHAPSATSPHLSCCPAASYTFSLRPLPL